MSADDLFPILEQLQDARGNRARARILLKLPDAIVLKYGAEFAKLCHRQSFRAGFEFCLIRQNLMSIVRNEHGLLPELPARELDMWRVALSRFASGEEIDGLSD